jgi:hypothetical protein
MLYNETEGMNIMICINGIEFYKQTFQWNITVENLVEEMVIEDDDDDEYQENEDEDKDEDKDEDENDDDIKRDDLIRDTDMELINELSTDIDISNKMVNDFVKKQPESVKPKKEINDNKTDTLSRIELESVISQKSEDIRRYIINAERARRAADMMHQKAKYLGEELQRYQMQLKHL